MRQEEAVGSTAGCGASRSIIVLGRAPAVGRRAIRAPSCTLAVRTLGHYQANHRSNRNHCQRQADEKEDCVGCCIHDFSCWSFAVVDVRWQRDGAARLPESAKARSRCRSGGHTATVASTFVAAEADADAVCSGYGQYDADDGSGAHDLAPEVFQQRISDEYRRRFSRLHGGESAEYGCPDTGKQHEQTACHRHHWPEPEP